MKFQKCADVGKEFKYFYHWEKDLLEHLPINKKILEVGCGRGRFQKLMPNIEGIEYEQKYVDESKMDRVIQGNGFNLSKFYGKYDIVFSTGMVEHYNLEEIIKLLKEQLKCLKEGGKCIVVVPRECFESKINCLKDGEDWRVFGKRMGEEELKQVMEEVGFKNIDIKPIGLFFRGNIKKYHQNLSQIFFNLLFQKLRFKIKGHGHNLMGIGYKVNC